MPQFTILIHDSISQKFCICLFLLISSNTTSFIVNVDVVTIELVLHAFNSVDLSTGTMKTANVYVYNRSGKNVQQATYTIQ